MKMLKIIVSIVLGLCATNVWAGQSSEFVPDANTVALWHLNGSANDASGNGNHLAVKTDRVSWVSGKFGQGAEMGDDPWSGSCFNSDGGALTAPGSGCTYPGSGDWTIEAWVLFPSNSAGYYAVSHYSKHWACHDPYHLGVSNSEAFFTIQQSCNEYVHLSADISGYVGEWVHLAGVYRYQQDVALYVNGVQVAYEATTLVPENLPNYNVFLGGNYCGTSTDLKVDEVRLSNVARYPEPVISALIDIDPDTLNRKSHGKWITVYITLPDDFDVGTIDTSSIAITSLAGGESCDPQYTQGADLSFTPEVGDRDEDGIADLTVKFDRQVLLPNLCLDDVSITIEGELTTGELFSGSDSIRIIDRGK